MQELNGNDPPSPTANLLTGLDIDEYFTRTDTTGARDFLTDALGSAIALTDPSGTIQSQYTYEPFGNVTTSGQSNANSYQFSGRENDGTGLYFYRARYYSPTFQRFVAQDPLDFFAGGPNLYEYTARDPVDLRDPTGREFITALILSRLPSGIAGFGMGFFFGEMGTYATDPCATRWQAFKNGMTGGALGFLQAASEPGAFASGGIAFVGDAGAQYLDGGWGSINWGEAVATGIGTSVGTAMFAKVFTGEGAADQIGKEASSDIFGGMNGLIGNGLSHQGSPLPCTCPR